MTKLTVRLPESLKIDLKREAPLHGLTLEAFVRLALERDLALRQNARKEK